MLLRNVMGCLGVAAALCLSGPLAAQPVPYSDNPRLRAELLELYDRAQQGDKDAEYTLGRMYDGNIQFAPEFKIAHEWYTRAAEHGHADAAYRLASHWAEGTAPGGGDEAKAREWFKRAAEMGSPEAQLQIATYEQQGLGGSVDLRDALKWWRIVVENSRDGPKNRAETAAIQIRSIEAQIAEEERKNPVAVVKRVPSSVVSWLLVAAVVGIAGGLIFWKRHAIVAWAKRKLAERRAAAEEHAVQEQRRREIEPLTFEHFPEHLFPRIPKHIREYCGWPAHSAFDDEDWDLWERLITAFPTKPSNETERHAREKQFWREVMLLRLDQNSAQPALEPKQVIIDEWFSWERHWFKQYYLATGIYHASIYHAKFVSNMEIRYQHRKRKAWDLRTPDSRAEMERWQKATNEIENHLDQEIPAHKEKWGEWFFFNVEQAFKAEYGTPDSGLENQNAHGSAAIATEAETRAAAMAGGGRRASIHDQEF